MNTAKMTINTAAKCIRPLWIFRLLSTMLLCVVLAACETTPGKPGNAGSTTRVGPASGLAGASEMYHAGDYAGAMRQFDAIISAGDSDANRLRLAHLGKILIYLGTDSSWHSLENAKMSLMAATGLSAEGNKFSMETNMLMDAVSAAIGAESEHQQLRSKSSSASAQVVRLQSQLKALNTERDDLLSEQKALSEALEKLKNLTLGN